MHTLAPHGAQPHMPAPCSCSLALTVLVMSDRVGELGISVAQASSAQGCIHLAPNQQACQSLRGAAAKMCE